MSGAPPTRDLAALLQAYVDAHNLGVRAGDWSALASLLHPDAEMHFMGTDAGPFVGPLAVLAAFRTQGPYAELRIEHAQPRENWIEAAYGWVGDRRQRAGLLRLIAADGKIRHILVVAFRQ